MTTEELLKLAVDKEARKATEELCQDIRKHIDRKNICHAQLSADIFYNKSNLSDLLNGKGNPESDTLMKIAKRAKGRIVFIPDEDES